MDKFTLVNNRRPFLEKFESKYQIVQREGLLHLFDGKKPHLESIELSHENQKVKLIRQAKNQISTPSFLKGLEKQFDSSKESRLDSSKRPLVHDLRERYANMRQALSQSKSQELFSKQVKLPAINKSSSHASSLHKNKQIPNEGRANQRIRSQPHQSQNSSSSIMNNFTQKLQLDKYALRHLQFLDKFQKHMVRNEVPIKNTPQSQQR